MARETIQELKGILWLLQSCFTLKTYPGFGVSAQPRTLYSKESHSSEKLSTKWAVYNVRVSFYTPTTTSKQRIFFQCNPDNSRYSASYHLLLSFRGDRYQTIMYLGRMQTRKLKENLQDLSFSLGFSYRRIAHYFRIDYY